jgi:2,4-dienoyl-CoA reductase-like NADH-dependent reductase (Old Yellow Enzyme family)
LHPSRTPIAIRVFPRVAQFKTTEQFQARLAELGLSLPIDPAPLSAAQDSPLAAPLCVGDFVIGNRWCIHPMEGWDGNPDGTPSELTYRRWRNFGASGAKLIWGGEAVAVQPDGRANPRQLTALTEHRAAFFHLLAELRAAHRARLGTDTDLLVGLQLTHSGRFARPRNHQLEPRIAYHHPLLDARFGIEPADDYIVWTDDDLQRLIERYVAAARLAREAGFQFVDIKACHGYLLHEFLSAFTRPGPFGGDFTGRTRLLCTIVERVRHELPDLMVGVRLSAFDQPPYEQRGDVGRPVPYAEHLPYRYGFGLNPQAPLAIDLTETIELLRKLQALGVSFFNISAGSPYYNPHLQRPATFPPSDGYTPPEDPLVGVVRQIEVTCQIKAQFADVVVVGSGYSYLQEHLVPVAQACVRAGWVDCVGLGRMVLAYPELPADTLAGRPINRKRLCRTFSDCTTAPRHGLVSGCYPLDPFYKQLPEAETVKTLKRKHSH